MGKQSCSLQRNSHICMRSEPCTGQPFRVSRSDSQRNCTSRQTQTKDQIQKPASASLVTHVRNPSCKKISAAHAMKDEAGSKALVMEQQSNSGDGKKHHSINKAGGCVTLEVVSPVGAVSHLAKASWNTPAATVISQENGESVRHSSAFSRPLAVICKNVSTSCDKSASPRTRGPCSGEFAEERSLLEPGTQGKRGQPYMCAKPQTVQKQSTCKHHITLESSRPKILSWPGHKHFAKALHFKESQCERWALRSHRLSSSRSAAECASPCRRDCSGNKCTAQFLSTSHERHETQQHCVHSQSACALSALNAPERSMQTDACKNMVYPQPAQISGHSTDTKCLSMKGAHGRMQRVKLNVSHDCSSEKAKKPVQPVQTHAKQTVPEMLKSSEGNADHKHAASTKASQGEEIGSGQATRGCTKRAAHHGQHVAARSSKNKRCQSSAVWHRRHGSNERTLSDHCKVSTHTLPPRPSSKKCSSQQGGPQIDKSILQDAEVHGDSPEKMVSLPALGLFATREMPQGGSAERHALKMLAPPRDEELDELAQIVQKRKSQCWAHRKGKVAAWDDDLASMAFDSEL